MWAGGRSGMKGMEALQVRKYFRRKVFSIYIFQKTADLTYSNEIPTSVYNPSGMYGLKAMGVSLSFFLNFNLLHSSQLGNNQL